MSNSNVVQNSIQHTSPVKRDPRRLALPPEIRQLIKENRRVALEQTQRPGTRERHQVQEGPQRWRQILVQVPIPLRTKSSETSLSRSSM